MVFIVMFLLFDLIVRVLLIYLLITCKIFMFQFKQLDENLLEGFLLVGLKVNLNNFQMPILKLRYKMYSIAMIIDYLVEIFY